MASVFVLTSGSYSMYRVEAIFSTRAKAEEFLAFATEGNTYTDYNDIDEYELDAFLEYSARGMKFYTVHMYRDGEISRTYASLEQLTQEGTDMALGYMNRPAFLIVRRWAHKLEDVIKIANEIRTQKIAMGEWE